MPELGRTLVVLVWKHLMVRRRRFIHSTFEFTSPAILFILYYTVWTTMIVNVDKHREHSQYIPEPVSISTKGHLSKLFFMPNSTNALALIELAAEHLMIIKSDSDAEVYVPELSRLGYWSCGNESELVNNINVSPPTSKKLESAGIIFQGLDGQEWPRKLNYTIRMKNKYDTLDYQSSPGYHDRFGEVYESFVALQWAIDTAYIQLLTGRPVTQTLSAQHFPMPRALDEDPEAVFVYSALLLCTLIAPLTFFLFSVARLVLERCSGVKELMKMVGVTSFTLQLSHLVNSLPACAVFVGAGTLLSKWPPAPMLPETSGLLVATLLFLYFIYMVTLAIFCSALLNTTNHAVALAFALYTATHALGAYAGTHAPSASPLSLLAGLVPHVPVHWFWKEVGTLLKFGDGVTLRNMFRSHHPYSASAASALLCLLVQAVLLAALAWYLDQVRPGKYGVARRWDFAFRMALFSKEKVNPDKYEEAEPVDRERGEYFEEPPTNIDVGIRIKNVYKIFGGWMEPKTIALRNVSLDIYKGEITVLLGHNGAGKTTLMSIITGMYSATEGKVYINGLDTTKNLTEIRKNVGLCPQHNLTFEDLTIKEHFIFFAMLKGATRRQAQEDCRELLGQLLLTEKADNMSGELSGGMRRRLQLGCALAGGAEVLILDEPTSGLDVETRRELWNLLLSLRGTRTVLLTTHFMEEADALGDRVAALHGGSLRCHATPMYLKRAIGTGYRLSLTLKPRHPKEEVVAAVASVIPDAQLKESSATGMSFSLPSKDSGRFPRLFNVLEEWREELQIRTMGVGVTTLEEVFLKLCSDESAQAAVLTNSDDTSGTSETESGDSKNTFEKLRGLPLLLQQFSALLKRQFKYVMSKKKTFFILEVLLPLIAVLYLAHLLNSSGGGHDTLNPPREMSLELYREHGASKVFYDTPARPPDLLDAFRTRYPQLEFIGTRDVIGDILREGQSSISEYNQLLVAVQLNATTANALYTTVVRHALPVAVNLLSNMVAKMNLGWATGPSTITTINHPVEIEENFYSQLMDNVVFPKSSILCVIWAVGMASLCSSFLVPVATLAVLERESGTRHLRIMTGVPCAVYYAAMWLFHLAVFSATAAPALLLAAGLLDYESTFSNAHFLLTLLVFTLVYAAAFTMFIYALSYFTSEGGATSILNIIIIIFCAVMPAVKVLTDALESRTLHALAQLSMVFPPFAYAYGLVRMTKAAQLNGWCHLNRNLCPTQIVSIAVGIENFPPDCCTTDSRFGPVSYLDFSSTGAGVEFVVLFAHIIVYGAIVILLESGFFNRVWDVCWSRWYMPPEPFYYDERVTAEKEYVDTVTRTTDVYSSTMRKDTALIHDVHKNYRSAFGKSCNSVKGVSFSIKHGECFGLLGVNGAGKSSVFKMLTGSEHATRGDILANGHSARESRAAYLSTLAYCPQFGGVDNFLSGWDNVELMVRLRGVPAARVHEEVESWIDYVDLAELEARPVGAYSGGCARRAATAAALAGAGGAERHVALLDEPTAGVDPGARRRVWLALRRALAQGLSVVITSHSMDETEALCSRIGIMSRGELGALGTAAELRATHATGYSAQLKLRAPVPKPSYDTQDGRMQDVSMDETDYSTTQAANRLKEHMETNFNSVLKDEHKTMLHYRIEPGIRYSELFRRMEELKRQFPELLEDYTISESTLEEVFLAFAKDARADERAPGHV